MPELPEVEHTRHTFSAVALGAKITSINALPDPIVLTKGTTHESLKSTLLGATVAACDRYGKWMYTRIERGAAEAAATAASSEGEREAMYWYLHLGMTGSLRIKGQDNTTYRSSNVQYAPDSVEWPPKYAKFWFTLTHPSLGATYDVAFCDPRRLGKCFTLTTLASPLSVPPLSQLGFDPLLNMPDGQEFAKLLSRRSGTSPIKSVLLDQAFAAGVGNWIADEVLYQAGVHPQSTCAAVVANVDVVKRVCDKLGEIVRTACACAGGEYPGEWLFHYRWANKTGKGGKEVARDAQGRKVEFVSVGGRTAAYVPEVQEKVTVVMASVGEEQQVESELSSLGDNEDDQSDLSSLDDGEEEQVAVQQSDRRRSLRAAAKSATTIKGEKRGAGAVDENRPAGAKRAKSSASASLPK